MFCHVRVLLFGSARTYRPPLRTSLPQTSFPPVNPPEGEVTHLHPSSAKALSSTFTSPMRLYVVLRHRGLVTFTHLNLVQ
jgi:hypothetical protein